MQLKYLIEKCIVTAIKLLSIQLKLCLVYKKLKELNVFTKILFHQLNYIFHKNEKKNINNYNFIGRIKLII